jgi:hypothetical protein
MGFASVNPFYEIDGYAAKSPLSNIPTARPRRLPPPARPRPPRHFPRPGRRRRTRPPRRPPRGRWHCRAAGAKSWRSASSGDTPSWAARASNRLGVTAAVGVVATDRDVALVIEQPVKDMQGLARRRPPDPWGRSRRSRRTRTKANNLLLKIINISLPSFLRTKGKGRVGVLLSLQIFIRFKVGVVRRSHAYDV